MSFRIRQDPGASDYEANEIVYRAHLDKIRGSLPPDLWRYFAVDFFHDGRIDGIDLGVRTTVSLWCPNIRRVTEPDKHEYANVCFQCEFRDVAWAEYSVSGESNDDAGTQQLDRSLFFSFAEIDSLTDKIDRAERLRSLKYHSLVIQMRPVGLELSLVFGGVVVKALASRFCARVVGCEVLFAYCPVREKAKAFAMSGNSGSYRKALIL